MSATCSALKPNLSSPMAQTASLRAATISADVTCSILWFFHTADTGMSLVDPGYFLIRFTSTAHWRTGQRIIFSEAYYVTVSFISSFFSIQRLLKRSPHTQDKDHCVVVLSCPWRISDSVASECWFFSSILEGPLNNRTICMNRRNLQLPTDSWLVGYLLLCFWRLQRRLRWG